MSSAVNTKALAYYASREKLQHDKGWSLHAQSNALPLVLRPDLLATVTV
ncbi:major capsid protein [Vitreoscilla stercoraria]|nr:major capsid protein [Vitreoscilla stercoraria]